MRSGRFRIGFLLSIAATLAGCLGAVDSTLPLLDYEVCAFEYPDGNPVPCSNQAVPVSIFSGPPDGWVCVASDEGRPPWWRIYRSGTATGSASILGDRIGLEFDLPKPTTAGALRMTSGQATAIANWTGFMSRGFVEMPGISARESVSWFADIYRFNLTAGGLVDARMDHLWSERANDEFWIIHRVVSERGTFLFQRMATLEGDSYVPADIHAETSDFNITIGSESVLRGGADQTSTGSPLGC